MEFLSRKLRNWNYLARRYTNYYWHSLRFETKITIKNNEAHDIEIFVEVRPHRYILHHGQEMTIEARLDGVAYHIEHKFQSLTIYAGQDSDPKVKINGVLVDEDWATPVST